MAHRPSFLVLFLRLMRHESSSDFRKSPGAYLNRAAVNASVDVLKARRRGPLSVEDPGHLEAPAPQGSAEPFDETAYCRLYDAIGRLKPKAAEVILLHHMQAKTIADIAKTLGVSTSVVAVRLFRARASLRRLLGQEK